MTEDEIPFSALKSLLCNTSERMSDDFMSNFSTTMQINLFESLMFFNKCVP